MKTKNNLINCLTRCGLFLAVAGLTSLPNVTLAQKGAGAARLIEREPTVRVADGKAVKTADTMMACPKCKNTWVTTVEKSAKTGAKPEYTTYVRHECPGCKAKFVTEGHGKGKADKLVHVCTETGSCCTTKGMEKGRK